MFDFDLDAAERYESKNVNAWWEGWTLMVFTPDTRKSWATRPDGGYRNGQWGRLQRVEVNQKGRYRFHARA